MSSLIARAGREWSKWWGPKTPDDILETAILSDDLPTLSHLPETTSPTTLTPIDALLLSAKLSRPTSFDYLLTHHPDLASSLRTESLLYAALDGDCIPVWRAILAHDPEAKNHRFGHHGTVIEMCMSSKQKELLRYLLGEGARVELGKSVLLRAEFFEADEEIKDMLVQYGARTDFAEEREPEGPSADPHAILGNQATERCEKYLQDRMSRVMSQPPSSPIERPIGSLNFQPESKIYQLVGLVPSSSTDIATGLYGRAKWELYSNTPISEVMPSIQSGYERIGQ